MKKELTDKYPLVDRALREQSGLCRFLGGSVPPVVLQLQERAVEVIEENVARPGKEKEAVMVGIVLGMSPPYIFDEATRFEKQYSPEVQAVVNDMLSADPALTPSIAQLRAALGISMMEDATKRLKAGEKLQVSAHEMQADFRSKKAEDDRTMASLGSATLEALYQQVKQEMSDAIDSRAALEANPLPYVRKPKGPGFGA